METLQIDSMIIYAVTAFILPWVNALFMKRKWSDKYRSYVAATMAFIAALFMAFYTDSFKDITNWKDVKQLMVAFGIIWPLSLVFYKNFAKPNGVQELEKRTTKPEDRGPEPVEAPIEDQPITVNNLAGNNQLAGMLWNIFGGKAQEEVERVIRRNQESADRRAAEARARKTTATIKVNDNGGN